MKRLIYQIPQLLEKDPDHILITILSARGSIPQVPGASAIFRGSRLLSGTLGGGVLEGDATRKASDAAMRGESLVYEHELNANMQAAEGAICGGAATLLVDSDPAKSTKVFCAMERSLRKGKSGVLVTLINETGKVNIARGWLEQGSAISGRWATHAEGIHESLATMACGFKMAADNERIFLHPVAPMPDLIIVGAGHIGSALTHLACLLDFKVTVIDDRSEFANRDQLPDADRIMAEPVGQALAQLVLSDSTYIVIVTRGHRDDAEALRKCIKSNVSYIGMIGSRRKIRLMREEFLRQSWATAEQFDRVHAPVGLEINSKTVQEIAISISAQLIQVRNRGLPVKSIHAHAIILAAGASKRMGKPKMLLPYGGHTILGSVVDTASHSMLEKSTVVLGANAELVAAAIKDYPVDAVINSDHHKGMLSSLQCGLRAIPEYAEAVMVLLGDQPMVETETIDALITAFGTTRKQIVVATHKGRRGHPILVGRKYIGEILELPPERTLRDLMRRHAADIEEVETGRSWVLKDIDTEQEYLEALNNKTKGV